MPSTFTDLPLLAVEWGSNSVARMLAATGTFIILALFFQYAAPAILARLQRLAKHTSFKADDAIVERLQSVPHWVLTLLSLCIGLLLLQLPSEAESILQAAILVIVILVGISVGQQAIEFVLMGSMPHLRTGSGNTPAVLRVLIAIVLWTFGVLLVLSNLGVNIVSLLTGLGIGGIAVALAVQNILSDMFSSFALYLDKPFREGDFIVVGQHMGVVRKVGLKTTRIQALQGEEIVISNQELTSSRIQNFKRMNERRVVLQFGVTYDATPELLRSAPGIVREVIDGLPNVRFDRAHFAGMGDSSLNFEVVYYVLTADYNAYMDIQQDVLLAVYERMQQHGLAFAFPTRTVHVVKG